MCKLINSQRRQRINYLFSAESTVKFLAHQVIFHLILLQVYGAKISNQSKSINDNLSNKQIGLNNISRVSTTIKSFNYKSPKDGKSETDSTSIGHDASATTSVLSANDQAEADKRAFVIELLKMLYEQYGNVKTSADKIENRQSLGPNGVINQLLEAIGADGDIKRLIDWVRNSFNLVSIGEITTQFVVSKLGSINCPAILTPDNEETLIPRFLLFNEHFVDVPFELSINPTTTECLTDGKFDPLRKTVVLIHGYLTGYTIVDGLTNIKNRILDLNKYANDMAMETFIRASQNNGSYVLTEDLKLKVRQQLYNVIIVDWYNGANPLPRVNYIRAAVNAQVVGRLIARFLSALVVQCGTHASNLQIIAHSLGCHVSGFTGKALNAAGYRLGKITHLDPIGLCFGRLFSQPQLRLSPDDALETQAVHVSLNLFDNPLDGVHSNFLVNGGRDQIGCVGQSELKNSTTSSVSLLFQPGGKFMPCSHMRALTFFEENMSSETGQCQMVGYRCPNYELFLAGKCGECDATNSQCRLMSLPPLAMQFRKLTLSTTMSARLGTNLATNEPYEFDFSTNSHQHQYAPELNNSGTNNNQKYGVPSTHVPLNINELQRLDRRLDQTKRIAQVIGKIRADTRTVVAESWTNLRGLRDYQATGDDTNHLHQKDDNQMKTTTSRSMATTMATLLEGATIPSSDMSKSSDMAASRLYQDIIDQTPLGGQAIPKGSLNGPLFFLGTGSLSPFCVNYYQFRVLIAESRLQRIFKSSGLATNRLASLLIHKSRAAANMMRATQLSGREMLHLTVKLSDSSGHFFKGFSMLEHVPKMARVTNDWTVSSMPPLPEPFASTVGVTEPMLELTMLLNTTKLEPVRISESIISYYFHSIVLADRIEINYMSNISPE